MTFDPYGNITYDTICTELSKDNVVDTYRLMYLKDKILSCSYYDVDLGMYVLLCDISKDVDTSSMAANSTVIQNNCVSIGSSVNVGSYCDDIGIHRFKIRTDIQQMKIDNMDFNYYSIPVISTKHAIEYHAHNVYKDHGEIFISFKKPLAMIDNDCINKYYNSMCYRTLVFCNIPPNNVNITTPLSNIKTLNNLIEYVHKLSSEPCHTINNRFGPKTYSEYNGQYYNAYHWVKVTK